MTRPWGAGSHGQQRDLTSHGPSHLIHYKPQAVTPFAKIISWKIDRNMIEEMTLKKGYVTGGQGHIKSLMPLLCQGMCVTECPDHVTYGLCYKGMRKISEIVPL